MIRFCPQCNTERPVDELVCEGDFNGHECGWDLADLPIRSSGWRPATAAVVAPPVSTATRCRNGHPTEPGDLMCSICGEDIPWPETGASQTETSENGGVVDGHRSDAIDANGSQTQVLDGQGVQGHSPFSAPFHSVTAIGDWRVERALQNPSPVLEQFVVSHREDGQRALLTLYTAGHEPDSAIYDALRVLPRDYVLDVIETGRWQDRAFEISEYLLGGNLRDLGTYNNFEGLSRIVDEIGRALAALTECGVRHRDLKPDAIQVRTREPLDLVITGFGSARLSEFDLDVVPPLETTRYTAPEAVVGGVAAASDWWSLGVILLEQVTRGACFNGVNDQAFLIHVLTNGVPIPSDLDPKVQLLLRGLLALDRRQRWGWSQVEQWLVGQSPAAPEAGLGSGEQTLSRAIRLAGDLYTRASAFALAAAQASHWEEARHLFLIGAVSTWAEEAGLNPQLQAELRQIGRGTDISEDMRLALALKLLNPSMPLVCRGEIVTPGWLIDNVDAGYELIMGRVPDILAAKDEEPWLNQLKQRATRIRKRAHQFEIALTEEELRVHLLSTSRSKLEAVWATRRQILPDTDHPGLLSIIERHKTEEDLIVLLSADIHQFRTADAIVAQAAQVASRMEVSQFADAEARAWLEKSRRELNGAINDRLEGFARCGRDAIDSWADQFRLEKRLPVERALVLLAVPAEEWQIPSRQTYLGALLDFFARRLVGSLMRGPLTRMVIGKSTARLDLAELGSERKTSAALLDHLLMRNEHKVEIDPAVLIEDPKREKRLRSLFNISLLYRRDTGIDGMYLGFPFLVIQEAKPGVRPRIAPVLLWPVKVTPEVGSRGSISLCFDRDREEVRLNPAFETLLGPEVASRWAETALELLGRATISAADVIDSFSGLAKVQGRQITALPNKDAKVLPGENRLVCAGVLFHLAFVGQAVMEDLRQLKAIPPQGTSLETTLRVAESVVPPDPQPVREVDRFFTASTDPSQERAVFDAREGHGLVVEGPPGTGKSQTIVNMVADAIGQQRSLLIVCQKQAALEVVYKRLESEGLGDRILMINDVNKDRRQIIQMIRDQLDSLNTRSHGHLGWRQKRQQTAARIEALDDGLNSHHQALHLLDEGSGLTYRQIVGDLIAIDAELATPLDAPQLRSLLSPLHMAEVATLQEVCGPLARHWLPARFENNPLVALKPFGVDRGTLATVEELFHAFQVAEAAREQILAVTTNALPVIDAEPFNQWTRRYGSSFSNLAGKQREQLVRWLPLLWPGEKEQSKASAFAHLEETASGLRTLGSGNGGERTDEVSKQSRMFAAGLEEAQLNQWIALAEELAGPTSFFGNLSWSRWTKKRTWTRFLSEHALPSSPDLIEIFRREVALRPWRARVAKLFQVLQESCDVSPLVEAPALESQIRELTAQLRAADQMVQLLATHPLPDAARALATNGNIDGITELYHRAEQGAKRHQARTGSEAALRSLEPWFDESWLNSREANIRSDCTSNREVEAVRNAWSTIEPYQRFRVRAGQLDDHARAVFAHLRGIQAPLMSIEGPELDDQVRRIIGREALLAWKGRLENLWPSLLLNKEELQAKVRALTEADREMRQLNRLLLIEGIDESKISSAREWESITRLTGQRALRLREFVDRGADMGLMTLRPVWLMNPDVASRVLPLKKALFQSVIYDEASQMPIEYALPSLFRSAKVVVSGDEKQMPPTSFFASRAEPDEAEEFESDEEYLDEEEREMAAEKWDRREIKDCPDLLQLAKTVLPTTTLQIHYRSAYRELIQFSNASFYANRLSVPARHPEAEIKRIRPIELIPANGIYMDQTNPKEAEVVADELMRFWSAPLGQRKSVGVVTFNRKQAALIEDVLERRAEHDDAFRAALTEERDRTDNGEDVGFFVKNVENVQGDERDVIVFSSTFGRNSQGAFRRNFGALINAGGERRLNVAVTRAREKVVLVTSMPIGEISDMLGTRRPVATPRDYLQAYFEYARLVSEGELDQMQALLGRLAPTRNERAREGRSELDGFQLAVAKAIQAMGWQPIPVADEGAFGVDFAIEDPRTGLYGIGIECDAPRHTLLSTARARELWRPSVLEKSIRVIHRVTSQGWYEDPENEKAKLVSAIHQALEN